MHGADGIDEISTTGYTKVSECRDGAVHTFYVHPVRLRHCARRRPPNFEGGDAAENAAIVRGVLDGETGAPRDVVAAQCRRGAVRRRARRDRCARASRVAAAAIDSGAAQSDARRDGAQRRSAEAVA